ncbi:MAG: helix-turn-helix domain-containing protein [Actinomycetaceae bacterium]|nr:helix-turn-helix domain-containing protein [Actinomycetaceae bacterium]MDY5854186.1 helix-turn-helix domain-containing protein [Arcanobacterium sp.]
MAQFTPGAPQFFTVAEVADIMRVSRMTIYRMVHSGELPAIRVGKNSYRVPRSALDQLFSMGIQDMGEADRRAVNG